MAFVWEQRKFVEFVKNAAKKNKDNIDLEPYAVTNDRGFIAQKDAHDDFGYMSNVDRTAYNIVPPNSFAYNPARINVGSLGYYEGTENVIVSSLYEVFQTEEYIDDKFLLHWFKSDSFPRWIEKLQEGSVRLYFYFDKLVQCQMMVPSLEEQKRISAYLDSIDQLITLHQRKRVLRKCLFSIDWEQRKLGEIGTTFAGLSGKSASDFGHGEASFITYMNVFSNPVSDPTMVEHVEIDSRQKEVEVGDVFFTTSSETPEEVGMSSVLKEKCGVTYLNSFCFGFRPTEKFDLDYLAFMLRSESVRSQIKLLAQGISRFNISKTKMMEIDIQVPEIDEQIAIGRYFSQLNHLITLHQCKSNFCKKNEVNAWEQRKLGELGEITTGSTPSTLNAEYYSNDGIPWVTPTDINALTISDTPRKLSEEGIKVGRVVPANTILCTCIASIGKNALLTVKGSFNQQINSLTPNDKNDAYFLLTESELWSEKMKRLAASGTMQIVNKTEFSEIETSVPNLDEQRLIGSYFCNLDNLITLHQWECNINENSEENDEKQRKPIKKLIISEGNLSLVDDMFLLHRMTFLVCYKYILLRLNVVKYKITIIIISNILYFIVSLLIIACYLIVINKQLIILIYVEISVVIIKGDDDYARIRS